MSESMNDESLLAALETLAADVPGLAPGVAVAVPAVPDVLDGATGERAVVDPGSIWLGVEHRGERVGETAESARVIRTRLGALCPDRAVRVEILRPGWLPREGDPQRRRAETVSRLDARAHLRASRRALVVGEHGENVPAPTLDLFRAFGHASRIRTPVEIHGPGRLSLGSFVSLGRYGKILLLEDFSMLPGFVRQHYPAETVSPEAPGYLRRAPSVIIGDGTSLGDAFFMTSTCRIELGRHVMSSQRLFLSDCLHLYDDPTIPVILQGNTDGNPLVIEDGCWLGIGVSVVRGVRIGRHAVVGAGSVVTKDVPPFAVVAGAPARIVRYQTPDARGSARSSGVPGRDAVVQAVRDVLEDVAGHPLSLDDDLGELGLTPPVVGRALDRGLPRYLGLARGLRAPLPVTGEDHRTVRALGHAVHAALETP
jgi:acetyltransferase-like isoleucine patch superfamily enzyme